MHLAVIRCAQSSNGHESVVELTALEAELIKWIADGKTNWEISMVLMMAERTVRYHVSNMFQKLGVGSRTQAVALYMSSKPGITRRSILVHADREIHP
jgi:DNA-binding CsgD family transcriptional regulator